MRGLVAFRALRLNQLGGHPAEHGAHNHRFVGGPMPERCASNALATEIA
jgi:hypothetical protein